MKRGKKERKEEKEEEKGFIPWNGPAIPPSFFSVFSVYNSVLP